MPISIRLLDKWSSDGEKMHDQKNSGPGQCCKICEILIENNTYSCYETMNAIDTYIAAFIVRLSGLGV